MYFVADLHWAELQLNWKNREDKAIILSPFIIFHIPRERDLLRYSLQRKAGLVSEDLHLVPGFAIASLCGPLCSNPPTPGCEMGTASLLSLEGTHHSMYGKQGWLAILKLRYLTGYKQKILRMKAKAKLAGCPGQSRQTTRSPWAGIAHTQPSPSRTGFLTICISLSS